MENGVTIADVVDPYNYTDEFDDFEKLCLGVGFSTVPWGVGDIILTCFWVMTVKTKNPFPRSFPMVSINILSLNVINV